MKQHDNLQPFLRCTGKQFVARLGTALIPITSAVPEEFDAKEYGILYTYTVNGAKLTAVQAFSLAGWIAEETGGELGQLLLDIQAGKCRLPQGDRFEVVWLDEEARFWG